MPSTVFRRLEPISKKTRVVASMKDAIASGLIEPGQTIVEAKIAQELGVGQGLIREALIELEHQGFIRRTPFSGTEVVRISPDDAQQIFEIRCVLEPLAISLAGPRISAEQIEELQQLGENAKTAANNRDLDRFFESHLTFRRKIWEFSGNRYLQQSLERAVVPLYALYFIRRSHKREGIFTTVKDCIAHQDAIIAAFRAADFNLASITARDFLDRTKAYLKTALAATD